MGKLKLAWSPIKLKLANKQKIIPIGRLVGVNVDIDGVRSTAYFEVIEIVDDSNPYPALLELDWAMISPPPYWHTVGAFSCGNQLGLPYCE